MADTAIRKIAIRLPEGVGTVSSAMKLPPEVSLQEVNGVIILKGPANQLTVVIDQLRQGLIQQGETPSSGNSFGTTAFSFAAPSSSGTAGSLSPFPLSSSFSDRGSDTGNNRLAEPEFMLLNPAKGAGQAVLEDIFSFREALDAIYYLRVLEPSRQWEGENGWEQGISSSSRLLLFAVEEPPLRSHSEDLLFATRNLSAQAGTGNGDGIVSFATTSNKGLTFSLLAQSTLASPVVSPVSGNETSANPSTEGNFPIILPPVISPPVTTPPVTTTTGGGGGGGSGGGGGGSSTPSIAYSATGTQTYTEDTPLALAAITLTNAPDTVTAQLTLSNAAAGSLSTATSGAVTSTFNAVTGIWQASGAKADVQALLSGVTFTPAANYNSNTSLTLNLSGTGFTPVSGTLTLNGTAVNDAPTVANAIPAQNATIAQAFTYTFPLDRFADVDGDTLTYNATLAGGGALPGWLTFNAATRTFSGTPTNSTHVGAITVRVTATDPSAASVFTDFTLTTATALVASNSSFTQSYTEDTPLNLNDMVITSGQANVTATITLSSAAAGALSTATSGAVTSTYNAGTGVWQASGAVADVNTLLAGLIFTPALNANGNLTASVAITDGVNTAINGTLTLNGTAVNDAPTVNTAMQWFHYTNIINAWSYTFPLTSFAEVDAGDTLTYTATRGDGSALPGWLVFNAATRTLSTSANAGTLGAYPIRITATDTSGTSAFQDIMFAVATGIYIGGIFSESITGAAGTDDVIIGESGTDTLSGLGGNDTIFGMADGDRLVGGDGNDSLYSMENNDVLLGENGNDTLFAGAGADNMNGGAGNDSLFGETENDLINGGADADSLNGGAGNDTLVGGTGVDTLTGAAGNDLFSFSSQSHTTSATPDIITDFVQGQDRILAAGFTAISTAAAAGTVLTFSHSGGNTLVTSAGAFGFTLQGIYNLTNADFWLPNIIGTVNADTLVGTASDDFIMALEDNDTVNGGAGNDIIWGNDGNDTLDGGAGDDTLNGGDGVDVFFFNSFAESSLGSAAQGGDIIEEFEIGIDRIQLSGLGVDSIVLGTATNNTLGISYNSTLDVTVIQAFFTGSSANLAINLRGDLTGVLTIGDFLFTNNVTGTNLANNLSGTASGEGIIGLDGDDTITAGGGNDYVTGGEGNDLINLDAGADRCHAGNGNNTVYGGTENDTIWAGNGNDSLFGENGNDDLRSGGGDDTVSAGAGNDTIYASNGHDVLDGGDGNDSIYGQAGRDTITGGLGDDHFYYNSFAESTAANTDTIMDFSDIVGNNDVFRFNGLGITGIGVGATQISITYNGGLNRTIIQHNSQDFVIHIVGNVTAQLDATDFQF